MEDRQIVDLYWARDERAIRISDVKYGRMLYSLSYSLLSSHADAEECLNDTYLGAWNSMPTARPDHLGAFLSKIIRHISVDRYRHAHRQKRGEPALLLDELAECLPDTSTPELQYQNDRLRELIDRFLADLAPEKRIMFVKRYFFSEPIEQIADEMSISQSKVKVTLHRLRQSLKIALEKEGVPI